MFNYGIEVKLKVDFGVVVESLSRIGIANVKQRKLWQTAHILHKKGKYYIVHFKEMYMLDGVCNNKLLKKEDAIRRSVIAKRLESWDMLEIVDYTNVVEGNCNYYVLKYNEMLDNNWTCEQKYTMGNKK